MNSVRTEKYHKILRAYYKIPQHHSAPFFSYVEPNLREMESYRTYFIAKLLPVLLFFEATLSVLNWIRDAERVCVCFYFSSGGARAHDTCPGDPKGV
jgi:hypothetical protein